MARAPIAERLRRGRMISLLAACALLVGMLAASVATATAAPTAYVTNDGSNDVSPIDLATNTAGTPIPVGTDPGGVAITPDGASAYVTNGLSDTMTPIDVTTNTAGTPIPVGDAPDGIAITPDGATAYVVNGDPQDTVTPIDLATSTAGTPIPVGNAPANIAITPDGATAYVTNVLSGDVTPIDLATNIAGTPIPVGLGPAGVAITPDGATAYVTNLGNAFDNVTPIDVATNTAGTPIPVGIDPAGIAITPDGATAYVANVLSSDVKPIDLATSTVGTAIPVGDSPANIAITPDGATAYVSNFGSGTVTPIDVATNTPGTPIPVGSAPLGIAITPRIEATPDRATLAFGDQQLDAGPTAARSVRLESTGTGNLTPGAAALTGADAGQFAITADTCQGANLTPGQSCSVSVTFDPSSLSAKSATLQIPFNDPGGPAAVALTGTGTPSRAALAALGPPAGGGNCAPMPERPTSNKGTIVLSSEQFLINQRIYQAAIRRANAIEAWLSAEIEARDVCGGALRVDRFLDSVGFVAANGAKPVASPRPLEVAPPGPRGDGVTVSAQQALINQRIAQAAIRRANALKLRIEGRLTGGDVKNGQLSDGQLVPRLGFGSPGSAPKPTPSVTQIKPRTGGDPGAVTLSATQLGINQRIGQQAVRRVNALIDELESGLVAANFAPGSIGGTEVARS